MPSFGTWITAAIVVTSGIALLESWDAQIAWTAAVLILLAMFLRYPAALTQIRDLLGHPTL